MVLSARVYRPLFGVVIFFTFTLTHAQNIIGPVGEPSGGFEDYSISCPDGEFLVGLDLRTGWYVDNIGLICAGFDAGGNTLGDTLDGVDDSKVTDGGTLSTTLSCPENSVINQFGGRAAAYLDALGARCVNIDGTGDSGLDITGGQGGDEFNLFCPEGQAATGISGRSGWWIDSASFVCERLCLDTPPQITLLGPADGSEVPSAQTVTFAWSTPGTGFLLGQVFQICISSDAANGCDIGNFQTTQTTLNLATATLTFNGNEPLFWSVRATNNCGEAGEFSAANAINAPGQGNNIIAGVDYRPLCAVYKDDRCSVCHGGPTPAGHPVAFPSQNDAQARFNDDTCNTCHYVVHPETSQNVWEFPPGSAEEQVGVDLQTFADPATCGDICRTVRNWAEEHDFIHHIEVDPLVRYGFEPATVQGSASSTLSTRPPVAVMGHAEYVSLSASWYRAGMPCDPINNNFPSAAVSGAGNSGGDSSGGSGAQRFDTSILDKIVEPPKGEPLWWIRGTKQPLKSSNPTDVGELPPECLALIKQSGRPIPKDKGFDLLLDSSAKAERLKEICKRIAKSQR